MRWCRCYEGQKLEDGKVPHALGRTSYILLLVKVVDIDYDEEVISLFEVELQKSRNLSASKREECGHREGVCVYSECK